MYKATGLAAKSLNRPKLLSNSARSSALTNESCVSEVRHLMKAALNVITIGHVRTEYMASPNTQFNTRVVTAYGNASVVTQNSACSI